MKKTDMDNPVLNAILSRTSIRSYGKEPPTDEQIDMMLKAAMAAPSAMATVKAQIGIPFGIIPFSYVTIGTPAENPEPKDKYDSSLIHYEKW